MKPWWRLPQAVVQTSFIVVAESLVIVGIAYARDEPPPSPVRPWAPPTLPRYEGDLRDVAARRVEGAAHGNVVEDTETDFSRALHVWCETVQQSHSENGRKALVSQIAVEVQHLG